MKKCVFTFFNSFRNWVLYMSFDKFLLAVESRDLSQADNSIIRVSSFPSWVMGSRTFFLSQQLNPEHSAKWMLSILSNLPLTRKTEKTEGKNLNWSKHQFCQISKCQIVFFCKIIKKIIHFIQRKKTLLYYSCQLEIDHVTQLKKETCQSTCNGP